jgi:hypothetical protein
MTTPTARVQNPAEFLFAGKAEFTLESKVTGTHYTYRVNLNDTGTVFFVSLLTGRGREYAGLVPADARTQFRTTRASKVERTHESIRGFEWFLKHLDSEQVELHHCGKCGRCGRKLTNPESIARGIGPECATRTEGLAA